MLLFIELVESAKIQFDPMAIWENRSAVMAKNEVWNNDKMDFSRIFG